MNQRRENQETDKGLARGFQQLFTVYHNDDRRDNPGLKGNRDLLHGIAFRNKQRDQGGVNAADGCEDDQPRPGHPYSAEKFL